MQLMRPHGRRRSERPGDQRAEVDGARHPSHAPRQEARERPALKIFASVKSKVQSESDSDAKQYTSKLVDKYTAAEKGHQEAIDITSRGIDKCKGKR